ncbi:hypothetical protein KW796_01805 [Candidatus Parcubacteria bacterium]|nr:hypothetical protein [Candidatus Parcubacteria bacterium]
MKPTKKNVRNKDVIKSGQAHGSAAPRMEPKVKIGRVRSKAKPTEIRKPRKHPKK